MDSIKKKTDDLHYDAFISYRHLEEDKEIAVMLQRLLEKYQIQDPVTNQKRYLRIFRDQSELPAENTLLSVRFSFLSSYALPYIVSIC